MNKLIMFVKPKISLFPMLLESMQNIFSLKDNLKRQQNTSVRLIELLNKYSLNFYNKIQMMPEMALKSI